MALYVNGKKVFNSLVVDGDVGDKRPVSYLKWHITNTRSNPEGSAVQLSEFYLYLNDVLYNWSSNVSITASLSPVSAGESIDHIIDGSVDTKYVTTQWGGSSVGQCDIVISLGETIKVDNNTSYAYATGNDVPSRDPVGWTLFGSIDGSNWFALDARDGVSVPAERKTSTEKFIINVGGSGGGLQLHNILTAGLISNDQTYTTATFDDSIGDNDNYLLMRMLKDGSYRYMCLSKSDIPESGEYAFAFSDVQCAISQTTIRSTYYQGNWRNIYVDIVGADDLIFPQAE